MERSDFRDFPEALAADSRVPRFPGEAVHQPAKADPRSGLVGFGAKPHIWNQ